MRHEIRFHRLATSLALLLVLAAVLPARAAQRPPTWPTPQAAMEAFVAAARSGDGDRMVAVLGPGSRPIVRSGDRVADQQALQAFLAAVEERVFYQPHGQNQVTVNVGFDNWPMPVPLIKTGNAWRFDATAGVEEMLNRRIGRNELAALETLMALVEAQLDYSSQDVDQDEVVEYAARIVSSEGQRDGLYWPVAPGEDPSPLGPLFAQAQQEGYSRQGGPYHGYFYRILTEQGPDARGGAYSYLANGHMVGGFAVVAWPAEYGRSGITTFLVNTNGLVWQKDLGPQTDTQCRAMTTYNPDQTWTPVR
jgi:hypothetical protein